MLAHAPAARPALGEVTAALAKVLADGGLTDPGDGAPAAGGGHLPRTRPPTRRPPSRPAARRPRLPENPRVPSVLVQQVADTLRRDYAATPRFSAHSQTSRPRNQTSQGSHAHDRTATQTPFPPGARIVVRDTEWLVRNCTPTEHDGYKIRATGV